MCRCNGKGLTVQSRQGDPADPRLNERSNVFLGATIQSKSQSFTVRIRNISTMGALVEGSALPGERQRARLQRGSLAADGEVAWQNGELRGIRFDGPVDVDAWVPRSNDRKRKALHRPKGPKENLDVPPDGQSGSVASLASEMLEICEQISLTPDLSFEVRDHVDRLLSIVRSLAASEP